MTGIRHSAPLPLPMSQQDTQNATDPEGVGPYVVERKLGSGGMGTVYLARHSETGEPAAVKVLPASLAREEGFILRFNREDVNAAKNPQEVLQSMNRQVVYFYAKDDITDRVLQYLNKRYTSQAGGATTPRN